MDIKIGNSVLEKEAVESQFKALQQEYDQLITEMTEKEAELDKAHHKLENTIELTMRKDAKLLFFPTAEGHYCPLILPQESDFNVT